MPIESVNTTQALGTGTLTGALGGNSSLDRDAFLKLLVAQLKNQDPLEPQPNTEFVAQLAQFSSLEQTMGINDRLDTLSLQSRGMANTEVINLVGRVATVKGGIVTTDGSGAPVPLSFTLDGNAETTKVTLRDQAGRAVRTLELGARNAGLVRINWDGRDNTGLTQPQGAYSVTVEARAAGDVPVSSSTQASGRVDAVSFDKGFPVLHLANGLSVPVADLLRVEPFATNP